MSYEDDDNYVYADGKYHLLDDRDGYDWDENINEPAGVDEPDPEELPIIAITINTYLPIYFYSVLNIDRAQLAFTQIFSYAPLLLKPLYSYYYLDQGNIKKEQILMISAILFFASFVLIVFSLMLLVFFSIFLGLNMACVTVLDATVDKYLIQVARTEDEKRKYSLFVQGGSIIGALMPNIVFFIIATEDGSFWSSFFLIIAILVAPVLFIGFFIGQVTDLTNYESKTDIPVEKAPIILMCVFLFLVYSDQLFQYPMEPWVLKNYSDFKSIASGSRIYHL